jgi:hypothetical protein
MKTLSIIATIAILSALYGGILPKAESAHVSVQPETRTSLINYDTPQKGRKPAKEESDDDGGISEEIEKAIEGSLKGLEALGELDEPLGTLKISEIVDRAMKSAEVALKNVDKTFKDKNFTARIRERAIAQAKKEGKWTPAKEKELEAGLREMDRVMSQLPSILAGARKEVLESLKDVKIGQKEIQRAKEEIKRAKAEMKKARKEAEQERSKESKTEKREKPEKPEKPTEPADSPEPQETNSL